MHTYIILYEILLLVIYYKTLITIKIYLLGIIKNCL